MEISIAFCMAKWDGVNSEIFGGRGQKDGLFGPSQSSEAKLSTKLLKVFSQEGPPLRLFPLNSFRSI